MLSKIDENTNTSVAEDALLLAKCDLSSKTPANPKVPSAEKPLIVEDVLIEEVSIDGMCGVY